MSNEEEKRCPLCAEEMDWTDQQFKPCQCGYQVCVWCWHHIIEMAEKDQTEGRCPACRTIYEKEKIIAMQGNSERMVTKSSNKKSKQPKSKPKAPEVKKDLTNVRVIQRKMAYVIGLPLSLADEDLLQRKEYFGQYGKISKTSLSRTAGGTLQHFINDSCSVYITYSREEDALRCIQSVHGFVLEGRFLKASFGTAKYCHAWLRNMPCNNPACLYLHNIGAEEDSFGKDEEAAVHTRNRVQQIVGDGNNILRRTGSVLPSPVDEFSDSSSSASIEKSSIRSPLNDLAHGDHLTGGFEVPNKMTTFVDIVGRPSSPGLEKDDFFAEDRRLLNLCSDLSSVNIDKGNQVGDRYGNSMPHKISSSSHLVNRLPEDTESKEAADELFGEEVPPLGDLSSKDSGNSCQGVYFHHSSAQVSQDSGGPSLSHRRNSSSSNFSADQNSVHSLEDEVSLPFTCVNSVLNDRSHEFQNSAKSDRIYRSSNSFSNEEIVEHLRRIRDDNLANDDENSALDAIETSIISNIMSMDFDSCDDTLTLPHGLTELLDETDDRIGSSWNSYASGKSGLSFAKGDGFAREISNFEPSFNSLGKVSNNYSVLEDYVERNEHYLSKPQYPAPKPPSMAPPGFSVPREAPPGFSAYEKAGRFSHSSSGNVINNSSLPNNLLQAPPMGNNGSHANVGPAILSCGKGKPTNVFDIPGLGRSGSNTQLSAFDDETKLWLLMQQQPASANQDSRYSQIFVQQTPTVHKELRFPGHVGDQFSAMDNVYGYSSKPMDQYQIYEPHSFTPLSQQKLTNGHISNGYDRSLDEVQRRNDVGMAELQRNENLGFNKYLSRYGDLMFQMSNTGDVYTRVFGM